MYPRHPVDTGESEQRPTLETFLGSDLDFEGLSPAVCALDQDPTQALRVLKAAGTPAKEKVPIDMPRVEGLTRWLDSRKETWPEEWQPMAVSDVAAKFLEALRSDSDSFGVQRSPVGCRCVRQSSPHVERWLQLVSWEQDPKFRWAYWRRQTAFAWLCDDQSGTMLRHRFAC